MEMTKRKPKIAIVLDDLSVGGIPVACISLLKALSEESEITLILATDKGELTSKIPDRVEVKIIPSERVSSTFRRLLREKKYWKYFWTAIRYYWHSKFTKKWIKASTLIAKEKPLLLEDYFDCAIAYHGMNISQMNKTLYQIKAKKKLAWIHGDHPFTKSDKKDAERVYQKFDYIFCVSDATRKQFLSDFSTLVEKAVIYYNHFDIEEIKKKSQEAKDIEFLSQQINLVTVGRISPEKGQDMIPKVLKILLKKNFNLHWYILGDGADRERIEDIIKKENLEENISLLGNKINPYPYMRACDFYVQPSYTEGYPLAILETAILQNVIIATDVGGAREHLKNGEDILFAQPNPESIAQKIELAINDKGLQEKIKNNLKERDFSNKNELKKLFEVFDK